MTPVPPRPDTDDFLAGLLRALAESLVPGLDLMLGFSRRPARMFVSSALEAGWVTRAGDGR